MRIALYLNIFTEEYQIAVYRGIRASAEELGIDLVCVQHDMRARFATGLPRVFPLHRFIPVDGVLILTSVIVGGSEALVAEAVREQFRGIPVLAVGNGIPGIPSILIKGGEAMGRIMDHLIDDHGFRRFIYLGGEREHRDNREREAAFRGAIARRKPATALSGVALHADFSEDGAARIVRALVAEGGEPPDAIVAASDNMAIGALKALRESGDPRWQACAVTGFDDIPQAALEVPALTTAHQPYDLAGTIALKTLTALIEGRAPAETETIEAMPVIRASCGCGDYLPRGTLSRDAITRGPRAALDDALIAPRERLVRLQRQRARSERLLRSVSILGQRLATVASIPEIMPCLGEFLAETGARSYFLALFPPETRAIPDRCLPVFAFQDGEPFPIGERGETMLLADFLSIALGGDGETTVTRSVYKLAAGSEIPGIVVYDVEDDVLPHMSPAAVFVAASVKRLYLLNIEKEHSKELEREVALRTRDLSETNRKLAEEAERRKEVEAEVLRIGELERQRFSLDLHDDICQRLAGISMFCKSLAPPAATAIEGGGGASPGAGTARAIAELSEMIDETLSRTRQYAHDSFPVELDSLGLRDAIGALCATTARQTGCDCVLEWDADPVSPLGRACDINVYRIVQEAIANAVRHSRATRVEVSVEAIKEREPGAGRENAKGALTVRIRDNGKGNPELEREGIPIDGTRDRRQGLGLRSMRYRARQIGASYSIQSSVGSGTLIELGINLGALD